MFKKTGHKPDGGGGVKIVMSHKIGVFLYFPVGLVNAMEIVPVDIMVLTHSFFAYSICYLTIRGF